MKTLALSATLLAIGLLSAGCGKRDVEQPEGVTPPTESRPAPTDKAPATEPVEAADEPAAAAEEAPAKTDDSTPAMEGPSLGDPAAESAADDDQASGTSPEAPSGDKAEGDGQILGAVGKSLFNAVTGRSSEGPKPTFGDAPGYEKQE